MLVKKVTYIDFNDEEQTDEFLFNLTEAELTDMTLGPTGGLENYIREMIRSRDAKQISEMVKNLILNAYGEKSQDGRKFRKSPEITREFESTAAFSQLYVDMLNDPEQLAYFIAGIVPSKMLGGKSKDDLVKETMRKVNSEVPATV